jgi:hypothetical protein
VRPPSIPSNGASNVRSMVSEIGMVVRSIALAVGIDASRVKSIAPGPMSTAGGRDVSPDAVIAENRSDARESAVAVRAERGAKVTGEPSPRINSSGFILSEDEDRSSLGSIAEDGR